MNWSYSSDIDGEVAVMSLNGDLIGEKNGPSLIEGVNDCINQKAKTGLIDISNVRYMNSSGIGVLITVMTKFRNVGGDILLVNPSEHVKKLLLITKLNNIFNIYDSLEEAKASL